MSRKNALRRVFVRLSRSTGYSPLLHFTAYSNSHFIVLHCTLHYTALQCTALPCTALHCTALHCTALHCTALHCTALHCTALHCTALHCTATHCTLLHYSALHLTVLFCTALTAPHCFGLILPSYLNAPAIPTLLCSRQQDHVIGTTLASQKVLRNLICCSTKYNKMVKSCCTAI